MLRYPLLIFYRKKNAVRMIHNEKTWKKNNKRPSPKQYEPKGEDGVKIFFTADEGRALEKEAERLQENNTDNIGIGLCRNSSDTAQAKQ